LDPTHFREFKATKEVEKITAQLLHQGSPKDQEIETRDVGLPATVSLAENKN